MFEILQLYLFIWLWAARIIDKYLFRQRAGGVKLSLQLLSLGVILITALLIWLLQGGDRWPIQLALAIAFFSAWVTLFLALLMSDKNLRKYAGR